MLNIPLDDSYLGVNKAKSQVIGHLFLGWLFQDKQPIKLNGSIPVLTSLQQCVAASDAEAELGAHFVNAKEGKIIHLILEEMGHSPPFHCDYSTVTVIINNSVKNQCSRSMEMKYFGLQIRLCKSNSLFYGTRV